MTGKKSPHALRTPEIPAPVTGAAHFLAAARYSLAGFRRLLGEAAARQELALGAMGFAIVLWLGASLMQVAAFAILSALLLAVEALNTAIECVVDHLAPNWEEFARDAKDLGSLATMCLLIANGLYMSALILRFFEVF